MSPTLSPSPAAPDRLLQKAFWTRMLYGAESPTELHVKLCPEFPTARMAAESRTSACRAPAVMSAFGMDADEFHAACVSALLIVVQQCTAAADVIIGLVPRNSPNTSAMRECLLPLRYSFAPGVALGELRHSVQRLIEEMHRNEAARAAPLPLRKSLLHGEDGWPRMHVAVGHTAAGEELPEPPEEGILVAVSPAAGGFTLAASFDTRRFDAAGAERILSEIARIAQAAATEPRLTVSALLGASDGEPASACSPRTRIGQTVLAIFSEQVRRYPQKSAVITDGKVLDYSSLDARSSNIASLLTAAGVSHGALVWVAAAPGEIRVATVLGILKAGAVCVPIDLDRDGQSSGLPPAAAAVSADCIAKHVDVMRGLHPSTVIFCTDGDIAALRESTALHMLGMEGLDTVLAGGLGAAPSPEDIAFASFDRESGLLAISHADLLGLADEEAQCLESAGAASVLAASVLRAENAWQILAPLIIGGTVVSRADAIDASRTASAIERDCVQAVETGPSGLAELLDELRPRMGEGAKPGSLKLVVVSDEPASVPLVERWHAAYPDVAVVQALRSAGAVCRTNLHRPVGGLFPLLGSQSGTSRFRVANAAGRTVPAGVPGEIRVAVRAFAGGSANPAEHQWVRTRQCGKRLMDGGIEWCGSIADGESPVEVLTRAHVEAALVADDAVQFCATTKSGGRLEVHAAPRPGAQLTEQRLREILEGHHLSTGPEFQVSIVDTLPTKTGGTVDRDALRHGGPRARSPRNAVDEVLVALWSEILKAPRVGIYDDFFVLGGHSLLAMQLTSRIRRIFQTDLSLRSVFESPSIVRLSDHLAGTEKAPGQSVRLASLWLRTRTMTPAEIEEFLRNARNESGASGPALRTVTAATSKQSATPDFGARFEYPQSRRCT